MGHVLALCGGVGGAKLAFGLTHILRPSDLTIAVNVGDDFEHLGLHISPDIDTVVYTLAGLSDRSKGWGLADETWHFMDMLRRLGGEDWFQLGDRDLAMHIERTRRMRGGEALSTVTNVLASHLGIAHVVSPITDDPLCTVLDCEAERLSFQDYFVRHKCVPKVKSITYLGADRAQLAPAVAQAFARPELTAIVICTSNPYLSIGPMLAIPAIREGIARRVVPCVAVSPLVRGRALKGPTTKLMDELGVPASNRSIADYYHGLIDALLVDQSDCADVEALRDADLECFSTNTVMNSDDDRITLARQTIEVAREIRTKRESPT